MDKIYGRYRTDINKDQIIDPNITRQNLFSLFVDPWNNQPLLVKEKHICMDWYTSQPFRVNWIEKWFMIFDKPPFNNREVPLYIFEKFLVEFSPRASC